MGVQEPLTCDIRMLPEAPVRERYVTYLFGHRFTEQRASVSRDQGDEQHDCANKTANRSDSLNDHWEDPCMRALKKSAGE